MRCEITTASGESLNIELESSGARAGAVLYLNGVPCHLERIPLSEAEEYKLDNDPEYMPMADSQGATYVLVPFSRH